jgi:hypothetical protein
MEIFSVRYKLANSNAHKVVTIGDTVEYINNRGERKKDQIKHFEMINSELVVFIDSWVRYYPLSCIQVN